MALLLLVLLDVLAIICPNCRWWTCCKTCSHCGQCAATSTGSSKGRWFGAVCHHRVCRRAPPYKSLATATCTEKNSSSRTDYYEGLYFDVSTGAGSVWPSLDIQQLGTIGRSGLPYALPYCSHIALWFRRRACRCCHRGPPAIRLEKIECTQL